MVLFILAGFCSGNVIAQYTPQADIRGGNDTDNGAKLQLATPSESHFLRLFSGDGQDPKPYLLFSDASNFRIASAQPDFTNFRNLLTVRGDGRVGIGTDEPVGLLHAQGPTWTNIAAEALTNDPSFQLTTDGSSINNDWTIRMDVSDGNRMQWRYEGVHVMDLTTSGDLSLNSLEATSNITGGTVIRGFNTSLSDGFGVKGEVSGILGASVVGVFGLATGFSGTGVVGEGVTFDFYAQGPGMDYGTSSSRRWKRNIVNIPDPLDKISKLRGVYFDWDEEHGGKHDIGFVAEEVGEVIPEIVAYEENGMDATGMDYSMMTPLLVEAANAMRKEYQEAIGSLKKENEALKNRLDTIERMLSRADISQSH